MKHSTLPLKKIAQLLFGLAACAAATFTAYAAVTFDATNGEGFVGKGDVQTAFGWNNAQLQSVDLTRVAFSYIEEEVVIQECMTTGRTSTSTGFRRKSTAVNNEVNVGARTNKKDAITGFNLLGFGVVDSDTVQWVGPNGETSGNACPDGSSPNGPEVVVSSTSGLFVEYPGEIRAQIF
jgi:hypothetical protein